MIDTLKNKWKDYWDDKDRALDNRSAGTDSLKEKAKIKKQREELRNKVWLENKDLLAKASALRDECFKKPALNEEANNLKDIISKFSKQPLGHFLRGQFLVFEGWEKKISLVSVSRKRN